jgi:RNA polymerase sigma-70 factor, ECF subfamily
LTPEADQSLVIRSAKGDRAAFEELVRRTARLLYAHLYLKTADAHLTEDLVQETLLLAWRKIDQLQDAATFRAWLMTIANSVLIDSARRRSRKKRKHDQATRNDVELQSAPDPQPTPAEVLQTNDDRRRVLAILQSLPTEYRQPLTLRYLTGADYETISRQLALTNGSLRGLLQRGMKMLREKLAESDEGAP